ncbi:MAG: CxxxxCH/CxxCH domain-containing protein, partial [Deltaproteobacteria bacterium]|nr:CxxxxCH/CxxCH domain-containing protein [Deltaproteobacteria bacterium]
MRRAVRAIADVLVGSFVVAAVAGGCGGARGPGSGTTSNEPCAECHGSATSSAPPVDLLGFTDPARRGVGAHAAHLTASAMAAPVACGTCHEVPTAVMAPGHMDAAMPAEVRFSGIAVAPGGPVPVADQPGADSGDAYTLARVSCRNVYCHGATLTGGKATTPFWNPPDVAQSACGACHGDPPPPPHPAKAACSECHGEVIAPDRTFVDPGRHVDGTIDVAVPNDCSTCHGSEETAAPPPDVTGDDDPSAAGVGAHRAHVMATHSISARIGCPACHVEPASVGDPGHLDGETGAEVLFHGVPTADGATPAYDGTALKCSGNYCHGATLGGGHVTEPAWTATGGAAAACGACHGFPPPPPHPAGGRCVDCHAATAGEAGTIAHPDKHVDGSVQVSYAPGCTSCHGGPDTPAPPPDTNGASDTSLVTVGAHRAHAEALGLLSDPIECESCHVVPATADAVGHLDPAPAEVSFSGLAKVDGAKPGWDRQTSSCSGTYCHGATLAGGGETSPVWTVVDGSQERCDSCHGAPPPPPHPAWDRCGRCHEGAGADGQIADRALHVDGKLQQAIPAGCDSCHGGAGVAAPPADLDGGGETTLRGVGAHRSHLEAKGGVAEPVPCGTCHKVPWTPLAEGHLDGKVLVAMGGLAKEDGAVPAWDGETLRCAGTYCHGATLAGGKATVPHWTVVDG